MNIIYVKINREVSRYVSRKSNQTSIIQYNKFSGTCNFYSAKLLKIIISKIKFLPKLILKLLYNTFKVYTFLKMHKLKDVF